MKKKVLFLLCILLLICATISAFIPTRIQLNGMNQRVKEYDGVRYVELYFNEQISIKDGAICYVYDGEKAVTKSSNVSYMVDGKEANVTFYFEDDSKLLELGKSYQLVIPKGSFYEKDNTASESDAISMNFYIPKKATCTGTAKDQENEDGTVEMRPMDSSSYWMYFFTIEMDEHVGKEGGLCLYRKNVPIMNFNAKGSWDFGFGTATTMFGRTLNFEKGINYSFVLLENSVRSRHRDDLYNAEARHDFVGAYERTFDPIEYTSCSVEGKTGIKQLDEVTVGYSVSVAPALNACMQLLDSEGTVIKETAASVSENDGKWVLTADFGGVTLDDDKNYVLLIPESTVVGTGSDITVNRRTLIPLNGYVLSVDSYKADETRVSQQGNVLHISNVRQGAAITVYSADGTMKKRFKADGTNISVPIAHKGMTIVKVDGKAYKL